MSIEHPDIENKTAPSALTDGFFFVPAYLHLEDGTILEGLSPCWQQGCFDGEAVFTTGMTGYDAALTDPSYTGQLLAFTFPLIGNYGVTPKDQWESNQIHAAGVIVSSICTNWSHGKSQQSLLAWLHKQKVPLISGIDTRCLTKILREKGTMLGVISSVPTAPTFDRSQKNTPLGASASIHEPTAYGSGKKTIIAVDCGMKANIMRNLLKNDVTVLRVPYDYDYTSLNYDGILLSNGPGDPQHYTKTIDILAKAMQQEQPIFGICLGAQLLALAAGASTFKMRFGHRGHNHPCMEVDTEHCFITSQNHGYAIVEESLPEQWRTTYRSLNDGTVEGIAHDTAPFFAVQFHPEASPGPLDTEWQFKSFMGLL